MWFSCFLILTGSVEAQVIWGGIVRRLLIAYFIGNISAKKYQNPFMCVKVIASQRWDVFWDTVYSSRKFRKGLKIGWFNSISDNFISIFIVRARKWLDILFIGIHLLGLHFVIMREQKRRYTYFDPSTICYHEWSSTSISINQSTRHRKHRRAAAKPAACAKPLMLSALGSQGKKGGKVR